MYFFYVGSFHFRDVGHEQYRNDITNIAVWAGFLRPHNRILSLLRNLSCFFFLGSSAAASGSRAVGAGLLGSEGEL
jgi:uncharacterized PurR-regulated membrane protein YhhQ (DUF165 family)